jgi:hypothetical protein
MRFLSLGIGTCNNMVKCIPTNRIQVHDATLCYWIIFAVPAVPVLLEGAVVLKGVFLVVQYLA